MYEEKLESFLNKKQQDYPYISHSISLIPFKKPSVKIEIKLEKFFSPEYILRVCNKMFPVDIFEKNFPISFSVDHINQKDANYNRILIIEIGSDSTIDYEKTKELIHNLDKFFKHLSQLKLFKSSFLSYKVLMNII